MRVLGAVLAGGRSRRFGSDKALAVFEGLPLRAHAVAALSGVTDRVIVCGRAMPDGSGIPDRPAPDLGPLGGLAAALALAAGAGFARVLTLPCDTPRVPAAVLRTLLASDGAAYLADLPVVGIWPAMLSAQLDRRLAGDAERSIRGWAAVVGAQALVMPANLLPTNVNRPDDLSALTDAGSRRL